MRRFACLILAAACAASFAAAAQADERVSFASAAADARTLRGFLSKPAGSGPHPAVVLIPTCLGMPANRRAIETSLASAGYVALFVDDFSARGLKETCSVDFPQAVGDAYGALGYLAKRPEVDPDRIAVVGFSQGADAALTIAASASPLPQRPRFRAAAAFYPPCANQGSAAAQIPTLILIGADDSVTPAADCRAFASRQGSTVRLVVYPGAAHGFDDPEFRADKPVLGMTLAYDSSAAEKAWGQLGAFLAAEIGR